MSIYLFSILDNVQAVFIIIGVLVGIAGSIIATIVYLIVKSDCFDDEEEICKLNKVYKYIVPVILIGYIFFILGALIPSQDSLIKSYIVINGKKQLTNGNIEKVIKAIDIKSDKLIENLKRKN